MAKDSVRDFDATAANNTDIQSVDIAENCAPSGINNAIRELMADMKDVSTGTIALESPQADSMTVTGDLTVDTDTLFVDASADAVGIGTTSLTAARTLTINDTTAPTQSFELNGTEKLLSGIAGSADFGVNGSASGDYFARTSGGKMLFSTDTGTTAHATLDSSGNLLVAQTSGSSADTGHILTPTGAAFHIRDGGVPLVVDRQTSDGDLALLRKDGTTVGSIGTASGYPYFAAPANFSVMLVTNDVRPRTNTGTSNNDNTVSLGVSSSRFKDLYLGGSVYLGGTAGANALDHYEEGTWTPSVSVGSVSYSNARYTRIGRVTHVSAYLNSFTNRTSTSTVTISGIPIVGSGYHSQGVMYQYIQGSGDAVTAYLSHGGSAVLLYSTVSGGGYDSISHSQLNNSSANVFLSLTYVV